MTSWPCLPVLFPFVIPSIRVWTGPVTCFSPRDYVKGDVISRLRLHYVKFHLAKRLSAFFLSYWFYTCKLPCHEKSHRNRMARKYKGFRRYGYLSNSQLLGKLRMGRKLGLSSFQSQETKFVNFLSKLGKWSIVLVTLYIVPKDPARSCLDSQPTGTVWW